MALQFVTEQTLNITLNITITFFDFFDIFLAL